MLILSMSSPQLVTPSISSFLFICTDQFKNESTSDKYFKIEIAAS
jgi:hypothetical protein